MPTMVAIYIRLSEEDKYKETKEQDSESIINQRSLLCEYAKERAWDIYDIYSDEDYSGSDISRPAFNKMLKDAQDGCFQVVLCKSLSRFARDVSVVETYINGLFIEWGIRFISLSDYADSFQKGNRKNIQINSLVNQWFLEDLSENIKSVMTHKKKQGQYVGALAPYGYIKDPNDRHKLIIDEEAAAVVTAIFQMYLAGHGCKAIANHLNNSGIQCPSKYRSTKGIATNRSESSVLNLKWSDNVVWNLLRNPNYCGNLVQNRFGKATYKSKTSRELPEESWIVVKNTHEPIISEDDFEKVQNLKKNKRTRNGSVDTNPQVNLLSGLLRCKICGRALVLSGSGKHNKGTRYLRCTGRKSGIVDCNCAMVKYDTMVTILTEKIKLLISHYCDFNLLETRITDKKHFYDSEILSLKKSLEKIASEHKKIDETLGNSYMDKSSGVISLEDFTIISLQLKNRRDDLNNQADIIKERIEKNTNLKEAKNKTNHMVVKYQNFSELTREIAEAFIEKILLGARTPDGDGFDLEIHWNI